MAEVDINGSREVAGAAALAAHWQKRRREKGRVIVWM